MVLKLDNIFNSIVENSIFRDKSVLQNVHVPDRILHRDEEINKIGSILAPVLRRERASNLFLYGLTGTGKTLSINYVKNELMKKFRKNDDFNLRMEYLNCKLGKMADTEYRILAEIIKKLGSNVPDTGLPTPAVYTKFVNLVDSERQVVVLILDEIDQAVKKIGSDFLYSLTRLNSELSKAQICIVGISNDVTFLDAIDPRVKSSLSEEEVVFRPYNASQLKDILTDRVNKAFKKDVIDEGVISKCSAFVVKGKSDARKALDLMRIAGELAERNNSKRIIIGHIDDANNEIERDKSLDVIDSVPKQYQMVLYSIILLAEKSNNDPIFTGDVYNFYSDVCRRNSSEVLTQRRVSDIIHEFDMQGIINARVISKGRGGRMREIKLAISNDIVEKAKKIINDSVNYV